MVELLVVLAIMAAVIATVQLAIPTQTAQIRRESERFALWLEEVRAQARTVGVSAKVDLDARGARARIGEAVVLQRGWDVSGLAITLPDGVLALHIAPEPVIEPVSVQITKAGQTWRVSSDGWHAFEVVGVAQ